MATETVEEVIDTWHRTETFEIHERFNGLEPLLLEHPRGLGYRPADVITSIRLHVDLWYPERQQQSMLDHLKALAHLRPTTKLLIWFQHDLDLACHYPERDNPRQDLGIALGQMWPYLAGLKYNQLHFMDDKEDDVAIRSTEEHTMDEWMARLMAAVWRNTDTHGFDD